MNDNPLAHWADIEPLLDQALALPPSERGRFLDSLPPAQQRWRRALTELLRHEAQAAHVGFLSLAASLPEFAADDPATQDAGAPQVGQVVGPWLLVDALGRGGMASVWLARHGDGDFQREVALKLPHSPSPQWAGRFRRERDILARLEHPGIARLLDAGTGADGMPWIAMECVQGLDILAWCQACHASVRQRVELLLQIADALQYAHSQLVVHRDIKPANVLVQDDGRVRLLDFGIARLLAADGEADPALTQVGQRPMTPEYASPEQVRGEEPGIASDVYALGVLAYRLLSGTGPYAGAEPASRHALERAVLEFKPPSPSHVAVDPAAGKALRGDLDTIVLKALDKAPAQRYPTVDAMAADLRRHMTGLPVEARAPSWRYVATRFFRRHRVGVSSSILAVASLVGTTAWALVSTHQARDEARRAEAMYDFVLGLFNPDQNRFMTSARPDMPLKEVVERGATRILTQLRDQSDARARLLRDLTAITEQMNLIDLSAKLGQASVDDALQRYGDSSLEYANALSNRLTVRTSDGQFQLGYDEAGKVLQIYAARHEHDPYRLGYAFEQRGGFGFRIHVPSADDAAYLQRAIALMQPLKEKNTLNETYLQLGLLRGYLGDPSGSYEAGLAALQTSRSGLGPESWQTALAESVLGIWANMLQRPAEAEGLLRHAVMTTRRVVGADTIGVARSEANLAVVLFAGQHHEEARQLIADALRITHLTVNAGYLGIRDKAQSVAIGLALRADDVPAMHAACDPYATGLMKSTTPYFEMLLTQGCSAMALREGDVAGAARWLDGATRASHYFANVPVWLTGFDLRRGEIALAQGRQDDALRLWRHCLAASNTTQLATQSRAWWLISHHARMDAAELARMRAFRAGLEHIGGERYYAEYLAQLRDADETQMQMHS